MLGARALLFASGIVEHRGQTLQTTRIRGRIVDLRVDEPMRAVLDDVQVGIDARLLQRRVQVDALLQRDDPVVVAVDDQEGARLGVSIGRRLFGG